MSRKRLKVNVFVGSSRLTVKKRAERRVGKAYICCPIFFHASNPILKPHTVC